MFTIIVIGALKMYLNTVTSSTGRWGFLKNIGFAAPNISDKRIFLNTFLYKTYVLLYIVIKYRHTVFPLMVSIAQQDHMKQ